MALGASPTFRNTKNDKTETRGRTRLLHDHDLPIDSKTTAYRTLAEEVGISHAAISKYETGQVRPEFFFRDIDVSLGEPDYRKKSNLGVKQA